MKTLSEGFFFFKKNVSAYENKTLKKFLHFISHQIFLLMPICFFSSVKKFVSEVFDICLASIKLQQNDWLIKANRFSIGEFKFILNTDWRRNK